MLQLHVASNVLYYPDSKRSAALASFLRIVIEKVQELVGVGLFLMIADF